MEVYDGVSGSWTYFVLLPIRLTDMQRQRFVVFVRFNFERDYDGWGFTTDQIHHIPRLKGESLVTFACGRRHDRHGAIMEVNALRCLTCSHVLCWTIKQTCLGLNHRSKLRWHIIQNKTVVFRQDTFENVGKISISFRLPLYESFKCVD